MIENAKDKKIEELLSCTDKIFEDCEENINKVNNILSKIEKTYSEFLSELVKFTRTLEKINKGINND